MIRPSPTSVRSKTIRVDAHTVRVSDESGKPAIVLLRMASGSAGLWDAAWEPLERFFRVVQFDLPMPPPETLERPADAFRELASTVREVMNGLGAEHFSVFGWNGGSHIALRCAVDSPEVIDSCILLSPFHSVREPRPIEMGTEFLCALFEHGDARLYAHYWFLGTLSPNFVAANYDLVSRWAERRATDDSFLAQPVSVARAWMHAMKGRSLTAAELRTITAPTLILAPTLNLWHAGPTLEMAEALHEEIRNAQLVPLAGYGSLVLLEAPNDVMRPLMQFVETHVPAASS